MLRGRVTKLKEDGKADKYLALLVNLTEISNLHIKQADLERKMVKGIRLEILKDYSFEDHKGQPVTDVIFESNRGGGERTIKPYECGESPVGLCIYDRNRMHESWIRASFSNCLCCGISQRDKAALAREEKERVRLEGLRKKPILQETPKTEGFYRLPKRFGGLGG